MLRLAGTSITVESVGWLVQALHHYQRRDAMGLAIRLERALDADVVILALNRSERHTLLSVLDDAPDGLDELRGVLRRELAA